MGLQEKKIFKKTPAADSINSWSVQFKIKLD